jgi:hypothetical protein
MHGWQAVDYLPLWTLLTGRYVLAQCAQVRVGVELVPQSVEHLERDPRDDHGFSVCVCVAMRQRIRHHVGCPRLELDAKVIAK